MHSARWWFDDDGRTFHFGDRLVGLPGRKVGDWKVGYKVGETLILPTVAEIVVLGGSAVVSQRKLYTADQRRHLDIAGDLNEIVEARNIEDVLRSGEIVQLEWNKREAVQDYEVGRGRG